MQESDEKNIDQEQVEQPVLNKMDRQPGETIEHWRWRCKISRTKKKAREEKRMRGYRKWLHYYRASRTKRLKREKKEREKKREKERLKRAKERERLKHKRPIGRPKKRGRKKKRRYPQKPKPRKVVRFDWKIVIVRNGKKTDYVDVFPSYEKAREVYDKIRAVSDAVEFPVSAMAHSNTLTIEDEVLLLQKNRDGTKTNMWDRNEFGKLREIRTNSDDYVIFDKFKLNTEEKFLVFGYPPSDRKTFRWIMENLVPKGLDESTIRRVMLFKNKIVFKNDDGNLDMVTCKRVSDAIRLYNLLKHKCEDEGLSKVYFMGSYDNEPGRNRKMVDELTEKLGISEKKAQMSTATFIGNVEIKKR